MNIIEYLESSQDNNADRISIITEKYCTIISDNEWYISFIPKLRKHNLSYNF